MLQTEFPFTLPMGYVDPEGNLHKEGVMRLATEPVPPPQRQRRQPGAYPVPVLRKGIRGGTQRPGGVWRYPLERLYEEVAYIAFHFHWPHEQLLALDHSERRRWVLEISKINRRLNEQSESS